MAKRFTEEDDALLAELGVEAQPANVSTHTPREERIIAGFEEIQKFVKEHGHEPRHGEGNDIFERLYAVRLDRIRESPECVKLLTPIDNGNLLGDQGDLDSLADPEGATDEELLGALGVEAIANADLTRLEHVRSKSEIRAAEEIAQRTPCTDFATFGRIFEQVQRELVTGSRRTVKYQDNAEVEQGDLFILDGHKVLIDRLGEWLVPAHGRSDRRLRVIYDNGTESDILLRSLQRALNKDEHSRRILPSDSAIPPLFSDQESEGDSQAGHIYVVRSLSDHPFIAANRGVIHKIGVTGGDVKRRIGNARKDPTFLLADVELVQSYRLANMNRVRLERLLHQFFAEARMDLQLRDRFGENVETREWFLVPLPIIQKAIDLLMSGDIENCRYDPKIGRLVDSGTGLPLDA